MSRLSHVALVGLILVILGLRAPVQAQTALTQTYVTLDGSFRFNYPAGWALLDDKAGTVLMANNTAVLEKAAADFAAGDIRIQVMSPATTQNLLLTELGITADTAMTVLLNALDPNVTRQTTSTLQLGAHLAVRADVSDGSSDIIMLAVEAGQGGVSLVLAFTPVGERTNAEAVLYAIAASLHYTHPVLNADQLQPISATNATRIVPLAILGGHGTWIRAVNFSHDGSQLVTGDRNSNIRIWDVATALARVSVQITPPFTAGPVFSPDGSRLLFGDVQGRVWLWDIATQTVAQEFKPMSDVVWAVAFSPDSTRIAAGSEDLTSRLWDAATGVELNILTGHRDGLTDVAFSPDGTRLATTSWDATLRIWDVASGQRVLEIAGPTGGFIAVAWSPDGARVAAGARNGTVRIFDTISGAQQVIMQVEPQAQPISAVAFSADGTVLAAGVQDSTVRLWETSFGAPLATLEGPSLMNDIVFSPDGKLLAAANDAGVLLIWGVRF